MPGTAANGRQLGRHVLTPVDREDEACEVFQGDQYCRRNESGEAKATTDAGKEYPDLNDRLARTAAPNTVSIHSSSRSRDDIPKKHPA
jgi:hypothetical protein